MLKHLNLLYPQWQGGGNDTSTYYGAKEIERLYLAEAPYVSIPVKIENADLRSVNNIVAYNDILAQLSFATKRINEFDPQTIFTVGGGCDADIPAVAHLNEKYKGDLTILWFDAHADVNTPEESPSKHFYGMPLRTLLGDGDSAIERLIKLKLNPRQVALCGVRELDKSEENFINANHIGIISVDDMQDETIVIIDKIKEMNNHNIYIHIDLDVLSYLEFPHVPIPSKGGLKIIAFMNILKALKNTGMVVGMGLYEYQPSHGKKDLVNFIMKMGMNL